MVSVDEFRDAEDRAKEEQAKAARGVWEERCAYCFRTRSEVEVIIAGPITSICGECVDVCVGLIKEFRAAQEERDSSDG